MAKRLYADLSVFSIEGKVWVINDKLNEVSALVIIKVITFAGEMLYETSKELVLEANSALNLLNVTKDHHRNRLKDVLIYTEIVGGKDAVMQSTEYLATYKELELPEG